MTEARTENEEGLSAVAGALICLGFIIGVGAIIILIILMRLVDICVIKYPHISVVRRCNIQTNSEAIVAAADSDLWIRGEGSGGGEGRRLKNFF